jgi:hypothetical protein
MPDEHGAPLPPLPEEVLDGEKESADYVFTTCNHKGAFIDKESRTLRCKCGAGWSGPNLHILLKHFQG